MAYDNHIPLDPPTHSWRDFAMTIGDAAWGGHPGLKIDPHGSGAYIYKSQGSLTLMKSLVMLNELLIAEALAGKSDDEVRYYYWKRATRLKRQRGQELTDDEKKWILSDHTERTRAGVKADGTPIKGSSKATGTAFDDPEEDDDDDGE